MMLLWTINKREDNEYVCFVSHDQRVTCGRYGKWMTVYPNKYAWLAMVADLGDNYVAK